MNDTDFIACDCDICKSMCQRPCWGTPTEIENNTGNKQSNKPTEESSSTSEAPPEPPKETAKEEIVFFFSADEIHGQ